MRNLIFKWMFDKEENLKLIELCVWFVLWNLIYVMFFKMFINGWRVVVIDIVIYM